MRGGGALGQRVVTGVAKVMAVSVPAVAVRKGFCKKRRERLRWQAPLNLGGKKGSEMMRAHVWTAPTSQVGQITLPSSAKLPGAAGAGLLPCRLEKCEHSLRSLPALHRGACTTREGTALKPFLR